VHGLVTSTMEVRALRRDEIESAAATLALAFDDDPLFCDMLPVAATRAKWLHWFHVRALRECFAAGGAFTLEPGPEAGVLGLRPPGAGKWSFGAELAATPLPKAWPSWKLIRGGLHVERRIHALHPAEPHVYVYVLGVHPSQKGRGLGGALLRHAAGIAKAAGVVAHLETSNPDNLGLYRHFGYEVEAEVTSHRGPTVWVMTTRREAARL
jgi:ribosomal protein S18 acetylase RimI-like enzyme